MSDRMRPIPFKSLAEWAFFEYKRDKTIFGVPVHKTAKYFPFGPAAGPHTQLAQNIVAAYAAGARFFELKTVQTLDGEDLPVSKPCIIAQDECYNVEWSTELRVPEAMDEYIKAWFLIKTLSKELGLGDENGFTFNMSVGYDLEGIRSTKIDAFIEGLKDASDTPIWQECTSVALELLKDSRIGLKNVDVAYIESISPNICDSVTLSTLHGCPPHEIERIASYLLSEKSLNTYVKCNPTLLGYDQARAITDATGFDYLVFDDRHFKEDLQFDDAVPMLKRLQTLAKECGHGFGVKLTNTFPVTISANELPGEEMYMSGRALFPLSIHVAKMLSEAFDGGLAISYSGGADAYNVKELVNAGISPVTMATTLLKPGGYARLSQIADILSDTAENTLNYMEYTNGSTDPQAIARIALNALTDTYYYKPLKPEPNRKLDKHVTLTDCFISPCESGCPIHQDIPAYIRLVGEKRYTEALDLIMERNPLPFITGTICPHRCTDRCTRRFYEEAVHIRDAKLKAVQNGYSLTRALKAHDLTPIDRKVAIIGAGPAGLSAAYFLLLAGIQPTVFERRPDAGGIVRYVIPEFRIGSEAIRRDCELIKAMGGEFHFGTEIKSINELAVQGFEDVIIATGAWIASKPELEYGECLDALELLEAYKAQGSRIQLTFKLGPDIAVIGGGNTAMDTARAAKRVAGVQNVRVIYRRTKSLMPADEEEIMLAMEDGVEICELLSPIGVRDGILTCHRMVLGETDVSGRRSPEPTEEIIDILASTVIAAIGEKPDRALLKTVNEIGDSVNIHIIGDAAKGPATVVEAIHDAINMVQEITGKEIGKTSRCSEHIETQHTVMRNALIFGSQDEGERCLNCGAVCEACVSVCPNRANIAIPVNGKRMRQIVHVDGMCNECGNCEVFCPYDSAPYKDKLTLYWSEEDFNESTNNGFLPLSNIRVRLNSEVFEYSEGDRATVPEDIADIIKVVTDRGYCIGRMDRQ